MMRVAKLLMEESYLSAEVKAAMPTGHPAAVPMGYPAGAGAAMPTGRPVATAPGGHPTGIAAA